MYGMSVTPDGGDVGDGEGEEKDGAGGWTEVEEWGAAGGYGVEADGGEERGHRPEGGEDHG